MLDPSDQRLLEGISVRALVVQDGRQLAGTLAIADLAQRADRGRVPVNGMGLGGKSADPGGPGDSIRVRRLIRESVEYCSDASA
jgi:hypothetical protein